MKLYDVKLLTITCEILAQKNVIEILKNHDITGYTTYEVEGNGAKGLRAKGSKNEKRQSGGSYERREIIRSGRRYF